MTINKRMRRMIRQIVKQRTYDTIDPLASKQRLLEKIQRRAEGGKVAMVYGGIDCDGVRVDNCVSMLPASDAVVDRWLTQLYDDAEGPTWAHVAAPSETADLHRETRDLALEAFEDGHPHILYA